MVEVLRESISTTGFWDNVVARINAKGQPELVTPDNSRVRLLVAARTGISESAVRRTWRSHGLQPHRHRQFKLSNDWSFVGKLCDVVGLYVDPPATLPPMACRHRLYAIAPMRFGLNWRLSFFEDMITW